jgi:DNA-binding CsgD family transcriptional regulator
MADVRITEPRQVALRRLLSTEPVPGEPIPPRPVFDAIARLVPCDLFCASLTDLRGTMVKDVFYAPGPSRHLRRVKDPFGVADHAEGDGPYYIGWMHWTRHPWLAEQCNGTAGVDDLAIGFRNGVDHVVQFGFVRESRVFSDEELAMLRMLVPVLRRLARERPTPALPASLTMTERRVLHEVAAGQSNADIAACFCVAESTVRKHLENAYRKLGVSNRMAAVARLRGADSGALDLAGRIERFA